METDSITKQNQVIAKDQLVRQLEDMPIVEVACRRAAVPRATYYRWLKSDPEFAEKCRAALEHSTQAVSDIAEAKLITAIQEGNMTAISFWLRNRHPAYQTKVSFAGTIHHTAELLTPDQEALVQKALRLAGLIEVENETAE
jgi:hypothetical protein